MTKQERRQRHLEWTAQAADHLLRLHRLYKHRYPRVVPFRPQPGRAFRFQLEFSSTCVTSVDRREAKKLIRRLTRVLEHTK